MISDALASGAVKDWEQYKMSVGRDTGPLFRARRNQGPAGEKRRRCRRPYIFLNTLRRK